MRAICNKCKWYCCEYLGKAAQCGSPKVRGRCHITGRVKRPCCGTINIDGKCRYYEKYVNPFVRMVRWAISVIVGIRKRID
jgi:hypothetical protein